MGPTGHVLGVDMSQSQGSPWFAVVVHLQISFKHLGYEDEDGLREFILISHDSS